MEIETKSSPKPSLEREFAESTSLHGIARVFNATRPIVKLIWIAIMLMCLCVCIWQISDRFRGFLKYKANTEISLEYTRDLDFPAVTICNFNRYRMEALRPSDEDALPYILSLNDYDYDSFNGDSGYDTDYPVAWEYPGNSSSSFNYTEFTLRAGFLMDRHTLLNCKWRGKNGSCSAANFSHVFTSFGNCWTFNSGKMSPILKESQAGSGNGVHMLIDIQQKQYTETTNIEAGLKVLVHDQGTPPLVESSGLAIPPGVHAFMGIQKHQYLNLEPPYGKCNASKTLKRFNTYTLEGCNIECRTEAILDRCECRLVRHPGNEAECPLHETCAKEVLADLMSGDIESCYCPIPCNYTTFTTSLSTATIPNDHVVPILAALHVVSNGNTSTSDEGRTTDPVKVFEEHMRKNWIVLDVFYEDINYQKYEQSEAITPSALISDIGGQLGLFLGASLITLAEIFSYLGRKIESWIHGRRKKPEQDCKMDEISLKSVT